MNTVSNSTGRASSLLFSMRQLKQSSGALRAEVASELTHNEHGRIRIGLYDVAICRRFSAEPC